MDRSGENAPIGRGDVIALGMFDGVHEGHRALLAQTVHSAVELDAASCVYTFPNHPLTVLGKDIRLLSTPAERSQKMRAGGIERVVMEEFTPALSRLSPQAFIERLLDIFRVRVLVVGYNYSFGYRGMGTPEMLCAFGKLYGFSVEVVPPVVIGGQTVSSSLIRKMIEDGRVNEAQTFLGGPYSLSGRVVRGLGNGRRFGFPTANTDIRADAVIPADGVYATAAYCKGSCVRAVTNVGTNPTVAGKKRTVETHLLGFSGNLYDEILRVEFLGRLRGEIRFENEEELKIQIAKDAEHAAESRGFLAESAK